ncbi:thymidine phosphorylase [Oceanobacter mangrovi]|uniref:thymidine phosphorylase n=1 Tax=Oceanobacter mangrovi TaxID=2862510 RepID=UPI001C8EB389|nr:thymidine phosphorylase [Oceanobacter mangrovi]
MSNQTARAAGMLVLVVGPSGVGKDTLIDLTLQRLYGHKVGRAMRVVSRPADAGGEDHIAVSESEFAEWQRSGRLLTSWQAHDLHYGLQADIPARIAAGETVIANVSRKVVRQLAELDLPVTLIEITASKEVLKQRLIERGRESMEGVQQRLNSLEWDIPEGIPFVRIVNDKTLEYGINRFLDALSHFWGCDTKTRPIEMTAGFRLACVIRTDSPWIGQIGDEANPRLELCFFNERRVFDVIVSDSVALKSDQIGILQASYRLLGFDPKVRVTVCEPGFPAGLALLKKKIKGNPLNEQEYHAVISDINENRISEGAASAFLTALSNDLSDTELSDLTRARSRFASNLAWDLPVVVDKHSMGGLPGSRVSLIIIPIIAALGLKIPKASSKAITSPAGTADTMALFADVDLSAQRVKDVVAQENGCIVWNGRISHTLFDDLTNAMIRPLDLDSAKMSVASILSKKYAAGVTHLVIDLPVGPNVKLKTRQEAERLKALFESVGQALGIQVDAILTDGDHPVGRGVGPALEARDVIDVLNNHKTAPADLRDKALHFAGRLLEMAGVAGVGEGRQLALQTLKSGAAAKKFLAICRAQGKRKSLPEPADQYLDVLASASGVVDAFDVWRINSIARYAGAPLNPRAGIDLYVELGSQVQAGEVLYRVYFSPSRDRAELQQDVERYSGVSVAPLQATSRLAG